MPNSPNPEASNDLRARLVELDAKATPGKLNAHGPYLSVREDITRTIEHLDELGVGESGRFQCVPFHRREDAALLAFLRNAVPDILEALSQLDASQARVKELMESLGFVLGMLKGIKEAIPSLELADPADNAAFNKVIELFEDSALTGASPLPGSAEVE